MRQQPMLEESECKNLVKTPKWEIHMGDLAQLEG